MKKMYYLLFVFVFLAFSNSSAQQIISASNANSVSKPIVVANDKVIKRSCGTMESLNYQLTQDPSLKQRMDLIELETQQRIHEMSNHAADKVSTIHKIAVVVHVVYSNASENLSDAQIYSQIAALNQDFRKQNTDVSSAPSPFNSIAADVEIEFCLASVDPNGNVTNGITRTATNNILGFSNTANDVKSNSTGGKSPWNTAQYLNMWVCNLQGSLLGYGQFPGGSPTTDGVVMDYAYFGKGGTATAPFDLGRTATHEVGHWLNLKHIWGDATCGDDLVNDTPPAQQANYGCKTHPLRPGVCAGNLNGEMFMNFMDYVDDNCMVMFTEGQKTRMVATLTGTRASLLTNTNVTCTLPSPTLACDTLANYTTAHSLVNYRPADVGQPGSGFIAGTNDFEDKGFSEKFNPLQAQQKIYGVQLKFARAYGFATSTFNIKVWKADFAGGKPGTVMASVPISLSQVVSDINSNQYTTVNFSTPLTVSSSFYVGFEFDPQVVDTISIYTTVEGQTSIGKAYEKLSNNVWVPFTDSINSWGLSVALAVKPIVCINYTSVNTLDNIADGVSVYPNPSNGQLNIKLDESQSEGITINIYNSVGAKVYETSKLVPSNEVYTIDIAKQQAGLYFIELLIGNKRVIKRINLVH